MGNELVVGICTFNRPDGLRELLIELINQSRMQRIKVIILVVDNSVDGNACWVKSDLEIGQNVNYLHVAHGGLSSARNAALDFARGMGAAIAFVDDDEVPGETWLKTANSIVVRASNEIIAGPVIPDFGSFPSKTTIPVKYWERPKRVDGHLVVGFVGDGNIVYPSSLILSGLEYSQEFSFTGGQDTDFLMRAKELGYKIRNLNDLAVTERVPLIRQSLSYLVDRSFHSSSSWVAVSLANGLPLYTVLLSIIKRSVLFAIYRAMWLVTGSYDMKIRSSIYAASVKGSISGLRGKKVNRYGNYQSE
jgi:succinoglycan biosynthesis protein ExoM